MRYKLIEFIQSAANGFAQRWKEFFDNPDREDCENCAHNGKQGAPCNECFMFSRWEKIMTNADKIRAMTDEELVKFFEKNVDCSGCMLYGVCTGHCPDNWLTWLKQPVEVET